MVLEEKHMYYAPISCGLSLGLQIWMEQLQLREAGGIMHPQSKERLRFIALFWANQWLHLQLKQTHSDLDVCCLNISAGRFYTLRERELSFNHQMDQFLFPVKVFIADKTVCRAESNLQAGRYRAVHSWKVSVVFIALSAAVTFLSRCPAGHGVLS